VSEAPGIRCPACGFDGPSLDPTSCGRCGVVFARYHAPGVPNPSLGPDELPGVPPPPMSTGVATATEQPIENLWALPAAFALAILIDLSGFGRLIIFSSASNWAHELGHATWRWLNGRDALPLLFFTAYSNPDRSFLVSLLVVGGLAALFVWARAEDCRGLQGLAIGFFVIFLAFAIFVRPATEHFLESFAGVFGEFWIAALWVVLFYYRFPAVVRWDNLRFAFLLLGALALTRITGVFLASRHDMSLLPRGAFFGGDGDLDHLLDGGWLVPKIRSVYLTTAAFCIAVIVGHYLYFLRRTFTERSIA
jgi:hypothetical protein